MAASLTIPGKLVLEPNVPQEIALKFPTGKIVESQYSEEKQVYFSLADGRSMYVSLGVAQSITNLMLGNRESFFICLRWNGDKKQPRRHDVWLTPAGEKARATQEMEPPIPVPAEDPSELERQLAASIQALQAKRDAARKPPAAEPAPVSRPVAPAASAERPRTKLEDALRTTVSALHAANLYAKEIGFAMPQFSGDEICRMVNTLIIDGQRSAGNNYRA